MNYLIINHIPFGKSTHPDSFTVGAMWLEDIRATVHAMRQVGLHLIIATPLFEQLSVAQSGSFNLVEINPQTEGFDYYPLPQFTNFREYLKKRAALRTALKLVIAQADVIQADYGGHPVSMGQEAWDLAKDKKRIWNFDGADPFPRLELQVTQEHNIFKKTGKYLWVKQFAKFCRRAMQEADIVFAHNESVKLRFAEVWNEQKCHLFHRTFVTDNILISQAQWHARQQNLFNLDRPIRLVAAGRQIFIKGTDHVLKAMAQARQQGAALEFVVMGEGENLAQFKQLAAQLNLTQYVQFLGQVPYGEPLFNIWAECDVMVITNLTAEISRNVFLSMARGLPLVIYKNPGTDHLIEENQAGILVETGNIEALAEVFYQITQQRQKLVEIGDHALQLAARYTLDACHRSRAELAKSLC